MSSEDKAGATKQIIENINTSPVAVFAINDYWTFDGYLMLRSAHESGETIKKTILPAIELRIESASKHRLNIHVILSDKLTVQQLIDFKAHLKLRLIDRTLSDEALMDFAKQLDPAKARLHGATEGYKDDPAKLLQIGAQTAEITKASFEAALESISEDMRLVMIPYDCYGGMEKINWKEQPTEDLYFMRMVDIVEERDAENIDLFACRKTAINEGFIENFKATIGGQPKPCISGSDGHSIADFLTWRKETRAKTTWIKADPTFEGLRQIIFEPLARVRVQERSPGETFTKPFLSSITVTHEMSPFPLNQNFENPIFGVHDHLPLNPDLVCIIGGRGTGKSCLVDYIGSAFGSRPKNSQYVFSDNFKVVLNKDLISTSEHHANEGSELPFVYISQNEVKTKITNGTVGEEIKQMLGVQGLSFDSKIDEKIIEFRTAVSKSEAWFKQTDEKGELTYDHEGIQLQIARFQSLLESITTEQNKEKLERFTANISKISGLNEKKQLLQALDEELKSFKITFDKKAQMIDANIPFLDVSAQLAAIDFINLASEAEILNCEQDNAQIRTDFAQVYSGDLSGLLQNAEAYRSAIEKLQVKQLSILRVKAELEAFEKKRASVPLLIVRELQRLKKEINRKWNMIQVGHPEWDENQRTLMGKILADRRITLEGRIIFDQNVFMSKLKEVLDLRYFRTANGANDDKIREQFKITNCRSFLRFMRHRLHSVENESFVSGDLASLFYDVSKRSLFLRVEPVITYGGRPLERLSVGQKGTVYLCLKLATQAFSQPLIFDQPEDDLDNEFIIEELVDIFRSIKQFRQVIFVTHNANLVVNADSEQVIVALNDGGILKYASGSLENSNINRAVRRILEGGDAAFLKRELRYNLK